MRISQRYSVILLLSVAPCWAAGGLSVMSSSTSENSPSATAAPSGARAAQPQTAGGDDAEVNELIQKQNAIAEQYKSLNQLNPISDTKLGSATLENLPANLKFLEKQKKLIHILLDPQVQKSSLEIMNHPNLKYLYAGFLAVFVFYFFLKRRVLAATDRWWARIFLRLALSFVFLGALFLVSYAVLGQSVVQMLLALKRLSEI